MMTQALRKAAELVDTGFCGRSSLRVMQLQTSCAFSLVEVIGSRRSKETMFVLQQLHNAALIASSSFFCIFAANS